MSAWVWLILICFWDDCSGELLSDLFGVTMLTCPAVNKGAVLHNQADLAAEVQSVISA
jgi:hypothetical protein